MSEYLSGNTENVLVVTSNATMASDLRVFSSDGNSTMRTLANIFLSSFNAVADFDITVLLIQIPSRRSARPYLAVCSILLHRTLR